MCMLKVQHYVYVCVCVDRDEFICVLNVGFIHYTTLTYTLDQFNC